MSSFYIIYITKDVHQKDNIKNKINYEKSKSLLGFRVYYNYHRKSKIGHKKKMSE